METELTAPGRPTLRPTARRSPLRRLAQGRFRRASWTRWSLAVLLGVALAGGPGALRATTYLWTGRDATSGLGPNFNWSDANNWNGAAPPSSLSDTDVEFGAASSYLSNLDRAYSVHSLSFDADAGAYIFTGSTLTIGAGGLTQNAATAQTFGSAVALGADQTWTLAAGTGALHFGGGLNTAGHTLTVNALDTTSPSGNVLAGTISSGGLIKTGAGTLTLSGTVTGNTGSSGGTVGGDGGRAVAVNAGTLSNGGGTITGGPGGTIGQALFFHPQRAKAAA